MPPIFSEKFLAGGGAAPLDRLGDRASIIGVPQNPAALKSLFDFAAQSPATAPVL